MAAAATAEAEADQHAADLATLAVADAARREWREANAAKEATAREADAELRRRGLEERIPVTDAEVAEASAQERETPAIEPDLAAQWKAEQTAQVEADRRARAEAAARLTPVTDTEIAKYGATAQAEPEAEAGEAGHDQGAETSGIHEEIEAVSAKADQLAEQEAARNAERRAEMDEPAVLGAQTVWLWGQSTTKRLGMGAWARPVTAPKRSYGRVASRCCGSTCQNW